jgi:hypothetical protein
MQCVECGCVRDSGERGWVTVLTRSAVLRMHYCPDCMGELVRGATGDPADRDADDE